MATVRQIIDRLGKPPAVAEELGVPVQTIYSWIRKDFVPEWRRDALLIHAARRGIALAITDFPAKPVSDEPAKAAA